MSACIPLSGIDAQLYAILQQVVAIGRHRRSWNRADVVRVATRYLAGDPARREADRQRARAEAAEAEVETLRSRLAAAETQARYGGTDELPPRRVVEINRHAYEVFALHCEGYRRQDIAAELGIDPRTVSNAISKVAAVIDADVARAAALVNRGVVQLRPRKAKPPRSQRRAAA